jgi:hypothetical protein
MRDRDGVTCQCQRDNSVLSTTPSFVFLLCCLCACVLWCACRLYFSCAVSVLVCCGVRVVVLFCLQKWLGVRTQIATFRLIVFRFVFSLLTFPITIHYTSSAKKQKPTNGASKVRLSPNTHCRGSHHIQSGYSPLH